MGICLKLVILLISDYNESDEELSKIAEFIAGISKDILWRVTAFHSDCKMADRKRTPVEILLRAYQHGKISGLFIVYQGNLPDKVQNTENTYAQIVKT
jgi:pyruvate formate lyase activating enzyme